MAGKNYFQSLLFRARAFATGLFRGTGNVPIPGGAGTGTFTIGPNGAGVFSLSPIGTGTFTLSPTATGAFTLTD